MLLRAQFRSAAAFDPNIAFSQFNIAMEYDRAGQRTKALSQYERALQTDVRPRAATLLSFRRPSRTAPLFWAE